MTDEEILRWKKQCLGKYVYKTRSFAERAAVKLTQKYGKTNTVYNCPSCRNYHLTTKGQRAKKP